MDWLKKFKASNMGSLADRIPQTGIESIEWLEFIKNSGEIIKTSTDKDRLHQIHSEITDHLKAPWGPALGDLKAQHDFLMPQEFKAGSEVLRTFWGEQVLELYFKSLLQWRVTSLDFRPERFRFTRKSDPGHAQWDLSRFVFRFDAKFSGNMALLYQGYYEGRPKDFRRALIALGLLGEEQDPAEIESLLYGYLGEATDKPIAFDAAHFKASFVQLFNYLRRHRRKISAQFIWMGLCLTGVYETLEALDSEYNMRAAYYRAVGRTPENRGVDG